jgi:hypothetical protein
MESQHYGSRRTEHPKHADANWLAFGVTLRIVGRVRHGKRSRRYSVSSNPFTNED